MNGKKIILFHNELHNGDIHMSRPYIVDMMQILGDNDYYYYHRNNPKILSDIENLKTISDLNLLPISPYLKISTWIGQFSWDDKGNYCSPFNGCNFPSYYDVMKKIYKTLNISNEIKPISHYVPTINYNQYSIENIKNYFNRNTQRNILICNNKVSSGQAPNNPMNSMIMQLACNFSNMNFIISNKNDLEEILKKDNIIYAKDIIGDDSINFDMNEISYIGSQCDVIIGRSSGPYVFSITKETVHAKQFICFCNSIMDAWIFENSTNILHSNDHARMTDIVTNKLVALYGEKS
jgi:hypothetical protein